jgi:hypothetical protein
MYSIATPIILSRPAGARVRTRLRLTAADEAVLRTVGTQLGHLASADVAWRCRLGSGDEQRALRKRVLTHQSSSRWAGSITRTSNDQWERARANLADHRIQLRRATRRIEARLRVPVGDRRGRVRGYATQAERFAKQRRLQRLMAELARIEDRMGAGRMSVCRGGRQLATLGSTLAQCQLGIGEGDAGKPKMTKQDWLARWQAKRLYLSADGDAMYPLGNGTIMVHPEERWCEITLPAPLAHLANRPRRRYRLDCLVSFTHRADEWAMQAVSGAVRYDISYQPDRDRWYLDASWRIETVQPPTLHELRRYRALGVDLNADHVACWVLDPNGNPVGPPHTIGLNLAGLPASTRDGRLRAAITVILRIAVVSGCQSLVVENLSFVDVRQVGRESLGRGRRGKRFRKIVLGMPTRKFRSALVSMASNRGLWIIAVDPGWTSRWGRYWQTPLSQSSKPSINVTRHHAAAVVIGRRGLGMRARRRQGVTVHDRRIVTGELPARPDRSDCLGAIEGSGPPRGRRAAEPQRKTRPAERMRLGDQAVQDRSGQPGSDSVLPTR